MIKPVRFYRPDMCIKCKSERSLDCYDKYSRPIGFSRIIDLKQKGKNVTINSKELHYMKCKKCNKIYQLDWKDGREIPYPLINNIKIDNFLEMYKEDVK